LSSNSPNSKPPRPTYELTINPENPVEDEKNELKNMEKMLEGTKKKGVQKIQHSIKAKTKITNKHSKQRKTHKARKVVQ